MATDSIMGLFATPEQYQQQRNDAALARGIQLAQLSPVQQGAALTYAAGNRLGGAIGSALGAEDPALVAASLRKQLAQGKDLTSSTGWAEYAKALQEKGDLQGAAMAAQKSTEIMSSVELKKQKLEEAKLLQQERDKAAMERLQERLAAEERMNLSTNETRRAMAQLAAAMKGEKPLTEYQGKSVTFGTRAAEANNILNNLEGEYSRISANMLPSWLNSAAGQQAQQAQQNFVNAVLRQESGAAINASEFDNAKKQYFPQPGDTPEVVTQKQRNRELVISGFARQAGPGGKDVFEIANNPPPKAKKTTFNSVAEAEKANLPKGTIITINGKQAIVE